MPGRTVNDLAGSASRKRPRRPEEDDGDDSDVVAVETARSDLRQGNAKRARTSDASSRMGKGKGKGNRDTTPPDDDEEDEDMGDGAVHRSPPTTQYVDMRDAGGHHLDHADADDYRATQRILRKQTRAEERLGDNLVAQNGILERIECVNFMCHTRLVVELGPLLNFIVGENGSGKSAVLTAITLCLGGKASSTNRGGSLKNFIKEGCDRASLSVKLKNMGEDAYRPEIYGDSIIVERTFSKTGTSGFKVKSAEGQTISTKKSEVDEVVEFYALQVDNPLNILSQDNARQFLNASSSAEKYKYFIEGVQLEQLDRDYRLISEFLGSSEAKLPLQKERLGIAREELKRAEKLIEMVTASSQLRRQRRHLGHQMCWSQVTDEERKAAEYEQRLAKMDEQIQEFENKIEKAAEKLEMSENRIAESQAALATAQEEAAQHEVGVATVKATYDEAYQQLQQIHNDERNAHSEAKTADTAVKKLEVKVREEEARLAASQGDEVVILKKKLEDVTTQRDDVDAEVTSTRNDVKELNVKCKASQTAHNEAKQAVQGKRQEIDATKRRMRDIEAGQAGKYDAYDSRVIRLIKAIEHDSGFNEKPVGPIGSYIQILKPKWLPILEQVFGGLLNDFIVTNQADQRRLQKTMQQLGLNGGPGTPSIIIANSRHIDTTGHEPDPKFDTALRILKFDSDIVRNQMIINQSIEQLLLIPDRVDAENVMFDGGRAPPNVKACLSFHDTKRNEGFILTNKGGNNISTNPVTPKGNRPPRMRAEQDSALNAQKEILTFLEKDLEALLEEAKKLEQQLKQNTLQVQKRSREAKTLDQQLSSLNAERDQISKKLDAFEGADTRLEGLILQLKEQQATAEHFKTQYGEIVINKQNFNKEVEAKKQALNAEKAQKKVLDKKVEEAAVEVKKWENLRLTCLADKNGLHEQLDMTKDDKRRQEQKLEEKQKVIKHFITEASKQAPDRVNIPEHETYETIQAQYESLGNQIRELERQNGITEKDARALHAKTSAALQKVEQDYEVSRATIDRLKLTLSQRLAKWRHLQRFISAHARGTFSLLLRERRFRGQLMINHREKLLSLRVEPEKSEKSGAGRNTKTLSGGEKSFSSICLLLSIWEAMGAPLRCLDEFDVFMDSVNRSVSTKMLITAARQSVGRQYIFITPNAIDGKNSLDKDVKIIRLGDPRQQRLADP